MKTVLRKRTARLLAAFVLPAAFIGAATAPAGASGGQPGAVYTISNDPDGNEVIVFDRNADGTVEAAGTYPTGGTGSGAGLGSQRAVVLSGDGRTLLAVNPGSNQLSAFAVTAHGLRLLNTVPSGGDQPTSTTIHGNIVYALNAGDASISGFVLTNDGLDPLAGSTRLLSRTDAAPAQIEFTPRGDQLVVTQRATNTIDVFAVDRSGYASSPTPSASAGATPFGFAFDNRGRLVVSNANGGAAGASSVTSYTIRAHQLAVIDPEVSTTQTAACWVEITPNGRFAYTTNTGSGTVSAFAIQADGSLTLLDGDAAHTGAGPIDAAVSRDGRFLYTVNAGADTINAFHIGADGSLTPIGETTGLAAAVVGLAAS